MDASPHSNHPTVRRGRTRALPLLGAVALLLGGLEPAAAAPTEAPGPPPPAGASAAARLQARVATEVPWAGEPVRIEGSGSSVGHRVSVEILGTDVSVSTTASDDGTFAADLPTTGLLPGGYRINVVDETTREAADSGFLLTDGEPATSGRTVTVVPGNPVAGDKLGVEGTGYVAGAALRVGVPGTDVWAGASAGPDGAFSVTLPTIALPPDDHIVIVMDGTGRELARTVVRVQSAVEPAAPSVTVRPGNAGAGDPITVSGSDFVPGLEVKLELWTLYDYAWETVLVQADGTFSGELPTDGTYPGQEYDVIVSDTSSGREILVPFRAAAELTVAVSMRNVRVGEPVIVEGTVGPGGVKITVPGTGIALGPELDEDSTYWAELPTAGLAPGEYTVAAVSSSGHYAETTFTLTAAEGGDPGGTPGTPFGPPSESPAPIPEVPAPEFPDPEVTDPAVPTPEYPAPQAPQRPENPEAFPEQVVADGSLLWPAQPGSPAAAAAGRPAPAAHGGAAAATAPSGFAGALPRTGAGIAPVAVMALSLVLAGAAALGRARRRRMDR